MLVRVISEKDIKKLSGVSPQADALNRAVKLNA
jgi:hypothetical protein